MARDYYYVWIEGMSPRSGEYVQSLTDTGYDVTRKISEALRVKKEDIPTLKQYLSRHGVADWVLDNPMSFVRTSYALSGTLLDLKRISI